MTQIHINHISSLIYFQVVTPAYFWEWYLVWGENWNGVLLFVSLRLLVNQPSLMLYMCLRFATKSAMTRCTACLKGHDVDGSELRLTS